MQLSAGTEIIILQNGFLSDGILSCSYPETKRMFFEATGTMRFRKENKFESIEYGLINSSLFYRLNPNFLLRFRSNLFLVINRWKDMKTTEHKVYDALIGDLSFSQSILYFPIHKKTFTIGFGCFENLYYIYSKYFNFLPDVIFSAGLKL